MSDEKISQLPAGATTTPTGAELMETAIALTSNNQWPLNSVRGIGIGKSMASAYTASISNPVSGMTFALQLETRPLGPLSPLLQTFQDDMVQDCGFYTRSGNIGTTTWTNGHLLAASTADSLGNGQNFQSFEKFEMPFFVVAAEGLVPTTDGGYNNFAVGISKASNNSLYAFFEIGSGSNNRITIAKVVAGSFTAIAQTSASSLPSGITGFSVEFVGNQMIAWIQINNGSWYPALTGSFTDFNLYLPTELANWTPFFNVSGGTSTPWQIGKLRTGYGGTHIFRDYRIVMNKDGTPYVSNGCLYFTNTGYGCEVLRLNPKNGKFEKVGQLVFNRTGTPKPDLNAHIVWDQDINKWHVVFASWGDGSLVGVNLYHATYDGDILNGVHTVANATLMAVTQAGGSNSVYDACLMFNYTTNVWMLAYAFSPGGTFGGNMRIVLDTSPDLTTWTNSWLDSTHLGNEGAWICKIGGNFYVFAGDGTHFNCWNLAGTFQGTMTVDVAPAGNPPSHFIVFPWFDADTTQYYALSWSDVQFNIGGTGQGLFTCGTPLFYKANQTEAGFEYNALGIS